MSNRKLLLFFVREQGAAIAVYLLFAGITAGVLALFQVPVQAAGYAAAICAFLGFLLLVFLFIRYREGHRRREMVLRQITLTHENLPPSRSLLERDYQQMVLLLYEELQACQAKQNKRFEMLTDYYTTWVHQIKTPMAAMRLLLQSPGPADREGVSAELQNIEQYVEMVLCYLRLDSGQSDYVIREYDLDGVIKQAVRKYASFFIRKKLSLDYEPLHTSVLTDEKWLLFVIEQVLSNALKYTKSGRVSITLELPKTLCIRDTGIGIAKEDLPRIFENGFTGYNGRIDKRASGIGLSLCRRICANLGHTIRAESTPGQGTCIKLGLENVPLIVE